MQTSKPIVRLQTARIVAGALLMSTIGYSVVGVALISVGVIPKEGISNMPEETANTVNSVLTVAGILMVVSSIPVRKALDANVAKGETGIPMRFRNMVVAMALSEGAGAMGFVTAVLTGSLAIPVILWGAAIGGCILHFPTRGMTEEGTDTYR